MNTNESIAYLLRQGADLGLAGQNKLARQGGSAPNRAGGGGGSRTGRDARQRMQGAAAIAEAGATGFARIIEAARTPARNLGGGAAQPATPLAPMDELGIGAVEVSTPWGKIALGGIAGLVVIGGIIWLVTRNDEKKAGSPAPSAEAKAA